MNLGEGGMRLITDVLEEEDTVRFKELVLVV